MSQDIAADVATSAAGPSLEQTFALPDGKLVILSAERFQAPELLFAPDRPDFWALPAVSKPVPNSLQVWSHGFEVRASNLRILMRPLTCAPQADVLKCFRGWKSDEARSDLQRSVLVTGGCAGLRGICSRLQSELDILNDSGLPLKVVPSKYGGTLDAWVGASMVSQLRGFEDLCITRAQYDEVGSDIAHRKCL